MSEKWPQLTLHPLVLENRIFCWCRLNGVISENVFHSHELPRTIEEITDPNVMPGEESNRPHLWDCSLCSTGASDPLTTGVNVMSVQCVVHKVLSWNLRDQCTAHSPTSSSAKSQSSALYKQSLSYVGR
ncbi:hypothetical protein RRG08_002956 [Elysia crispata]|uniref:Uncharacterized protein n=1 Tax=Elysia crispata TaxID=231223 RepID=A0AAE1AQT1_9GAST|nr:hypothetical protein RRG08_002956 [Elysia crispata]